MGVGGRRGKGTFVAVPLEAARFALLGRIRLAARAAAVERVAAALAAQLSLRGLLLRPRPLARRLVLGPVLLPAGWEQKRKCEDATQRSCSHFWLFEKSVEFSKTKCARDAKEK